MDQGRVGSSATLTTRSEIVELQTRLAQGPIGEAQLQRRIEDQAVMNTRKEQLLNTAHLEIAQAAQHMESQEANANEQAQASRRRPSYV